MLLLLELNDESKVRPVSVHWELRTAGPFGRWVSAEPVEQRLAASDGLEDLVAQVESVILVGVGTAGHGSILTG